MDKKHVFISYKSHEREKALDTKRFLEQNGIPCWIDQSEIYIGENYASVINNAIKSSFAVIIILSSEAAASKHVQSELALAAKYSIPALAFAIEDFDTTAKYNFNFTLEERYKAFEDEDMALQQLLSKLLNLKSTLDYDPYDVKQFFKNRKKYLEKKKKTTEPLLTRIKNHYIDYYKSLSASSSALPPKEIKLYKAFPLNLTPYSKEYSLNPNVRKALNIHTVCIAFASVMCFFASSICLQRLFSYKIPNIVNLFLSAIITFVFFLIGEKIAGLLIRIIGKIKNTFLVVITSLITAIILSSTLTRLLVQLFAQIITEVIWNEYL